MTGNLDSALRHDRERRHLSTLLIYNLVWDKVTRLMEWI
jgi:hypothetical protein